MATTPHLAQNPYDQMKKVLDLNNILRHLRNTILRPKDEDAFWEENHRKIFFHMGVILGSELHGSNHSQDSDDKSWLAAKAKCEEVLADCEKCVQGDEGQRQEILMGIAPWLLEMSFNDMKAEVRNRRPVLV